nr:MAG TPA: hypothetical protein [Caudoviricetes sp.]
MSFSFVRAAAKCTGIVNSHLFYQLLILGDLK